MAQRLSRAAVGLVIALLASVMPMSVAAGEDALRGDLQRAAAARFNDSLSQAIASGLDPVRADQLMWRFSQTISRRSTQWWQAPLVDWETLQRIDQLSLEINSAYRERVAEERDSLLRALRRWSELEDEAHAGAISTRGLDDTRARFVHYAALSTTPNDFAGVAHVLAAQAAILQERLAGYRAARGETMASLETARALLSSARHFAELRIDPFQAQLDSAVAEIGNAHLADEFAPIRGRLDQTGLRIQGLLDARSAAYGQLSQASGALSNARASGVDTGPGAAAIASLAQKLSFAGDQETFQWITAQLAQQTQDLNDAVLLKQLSSYNPGNLPPGKIIVVSLSRQILTAYQDGQLVITTFVTTGRPDLPTPLGITQITAKYSPFLFVSPWAYGSPYWYESSWTTYAMLFRGGGYFIHDAPWRSVYGPSVNRWNGSHGCVNVPLGTMASLWNWTPIGTTVVVQP